MIAAIFLPRARSQNVVYSLPTQLSSVERSQLSSSNGDVFVGAGGTLYRLSSELQLLQSVSIPDSPSVLGLTTTADGDYLVACFTSRTCAVYNTTTLSTVDHVIEAQNFLPSGVSVIGLFTASSLSVYVGFRDGNRFELRQRGFAGNTFLKTYQSFTSGNVLTITRHIYGGFVYGSNVYFLALDSIIVATTMYTIRVCNDGQLAARYELQLTCGGTTLSSSSVITGVSEVNGTLVVSVDGRVCSYNLTTIDTILENFFTTCLVNRMGANDPQFGPRGACSQVSGVSNEIQYMIIFKYCAGKFIFALLFLQGNDNQQMCVFVPSTSFRNVVLNPQTMMSGSLLISEGVNASLAISVEGNLFLFVATANSVEKVSVTIIYHQYIGYSSSQHLFTAGSSGTTLLYSIPVSSPVTTLSWSSAVDYVYATVGNQVRLIYSHTTHST